MRIKKGNKWKVVFITLEGLFEPSVFCFDKFTSYIPEYNEWVAEILD